MISGFQDRQNEFINFIFNNKINRRKKDNRYLAKDLAPCQGACNIPIRLVGGDEDLIIVVHAELLKVEKDVMFVGHFQRDLFYFGKVFQDVFAHGVERVLNGEAFVGGEGMQEIFTDGVIAMFGIGRCCFVDPGDVTFGGKDTVACLFQGGVFIPDVILETGVGGF